MRHLKLFEDFEREAKHPKLLLHIAKVESRDFIEKNGLVPRLPTDEWKAKWKEQEDADTGGGAVETGEWYAAWTKPAVFMMPFDGKMDIDSIRKQLFPIGWLKGEMTFDEFVDANDLEPKEKPSGTPVGIAGFWEDWENEVGPKYNEYLLKTCTYDVWLIDTEKTNVKIYKDPEYREWPYNFDSLMSLEPIEPSAIKLLVKDNKTLL